MGPLKNAIIKAFGQSSPNNNKNEQPCISEVVSKLWLQVKIEGMEEKPIVHKAIGQFYKEEEDGLVPVEGYNGQYDEYVDHMQKERTINNNNKRHSLPEKLRKSSNLDLPNQETNQILTKFNSMPETTSRNKKSLRRFCADYKKD